LASDKLGKLNCSLQGCKKETNWFSNFVHNTNSVQVSMGGGYSPDIKTIIEAHANTYRVAKTYSKNS
jgi:acetoin utilization deacetylase AcuC-like enzyme